MNLNEVDKPKVTKTVVVYSGRFQPFHKGHYITYLKLCNKFGRNNVYIGTSNDTSGPKSPFNFNEKVKIMTTMFDIPSNKIVQVRNPYAPKEILSQFDGKTTQYIAAVGEKDASRLKGKYFKPYNDKAGYGYDEIGYVYPVPAETNAISGTDVRSWLGKDSKNKEKGFLKAYPKFDKDIYKMITGKLNEDGLPGGVGVGLVLPGGYINGAPTGSTNESNNTQPSTEFREEPHPTRHEREHPSNEPDWHKQDKPYDPISELVEKYITNEMFEEFAKNYFKEESEASKQGLIHLGGGYYGKDKGGPATHKSENGKLRVLTPAEIAAEKQKRMGKSAATGKGKPSQPGQPVKKGDTQQGKITKGIPGTPVNKAGSPVPVKGIAGTPVDKSGSPVKKGEKAPPPPEQKLHGAELKSNAEKNAEKEHGSTPEEKGWLQRWGDSYKSEIKEIGDTIKTFFDEDEAHAAHEAHDPHSKTRKSWTEHATDFISKMPANIVKHAVKVAKQKVHQVKNTARGIQSLAVSFAQTGEMKFGMFKDKDGKWKHSKHEAERQRTACLNTVKDVAITAASVVLGGVVGGAIKHAASAGAFNSGLGQGLATMAQKGVEGGLETLSHGVGGFLSHMAVDFAKHCGKESIGLAANAGHGDSYYGAAAHNIWQAGKDAAFGHATQHTVSGLGHVAAGAGHLLKHALTEVEETENNVIKQNVSTYTELLKQVLEKMQTYEPNPKQYLAMLKSYAEQKQKNNLEKLAGPINENLSDSKKQNIQHFVEYATKRLKLAENPKITLIGGNEYGNVKSSLGGYNPEDKTIYVATEGRLTADILRTIAHEMVHRKQDEMGLIGDSVKDGADGSPIENKAHAVAGILMREYGRINKQIYNEGTDTGNHNSDGIHNNHNVSWKEYDNPAKGYVDMLDGWEVYGHLSDEMPESVLKAELPVNTHIDPKKVKGTNHLKEDVNVDVDKGDTVLMGKFKNKKVTVKDIGTDDHGMPTINGKKAVTFRIPRGNEVVNEVGSNDWHFKAIMKMWDTAGSFGKKKIGAVICKNPKATRNDIARELRSYGYGEATDATDQLGLDEKKNLKEVSVNTGQDGQQDGAYIPKGKGRVLDANDGVNKSDDWFYSGGYIQTDFPVADQIWGDDDENQTIVKYSARNLPRFDEEPTKFLKEASLNELTQGLFAGKVKIGGHPVDLEVELLGADNKTKEFITKVIHIDKQYQHKLPIGSTFKIPARVFRMPGGGWHKIKSSAFKESVNEAVKWESEVFDKCLRGEVPLSLNIVKKLVDPIVAKSLHVTDIDNLSKLAALEGTKKSISTFNKTTKTGKIAQGKGLWTKGGVIVSMTGTILAQSIHDLWTYPDHQGRRWIEPGVMFDNPTRSRYQVYDFAPELEPYRVKYMQQYFSGNITNQEKADFIKKYFEAAEKFMLSRKKEFVDRYSNANTLYYESDWNEVVLTNIKIEKILIIPADEDEKEIQKIKQKYKNVEVAKDEADIENFINNNGGKVLNESINQSKKLIMEGGAYGHMSHPFDDMDLTFGDLKNIIKGALTGNLELTREKTDGQALAISWKNGRLIAARNKGNLANAGANAMGIEDVAAKFAGRGGLTDAYNFAMKDLSVAIQALSEPQRKKIFDEGKCFMNLEVIWPTSVNVIPYGQALLVFHNTTCYDEKGTAIGANQGAATMLAGMIKQVNADVQSKYTIQGPPVTQLPKNEELSSKQAKYLTQLQKLQFEFQLSDKDGVSEYHQAWWENFINKSGVKLQKLEKEALIRRWAFGDKSFRLNTIADKDAQKWAMENDKVNVAKQQKENVRQFEEIFLGVGADVLSFMGSVLTVNPDVAVRNMKDRLKATADKVRGSGDPSKIAKLKMELERMKSIGGSNKIVPNEGIVFVYKGNTYKLTGTFAPLNQILGIFYE